MVIFCRSKLASGSNGSVLGILGSWSVCRSRSEIEPEDSSDEEAADDLPRVCDAADLFERIRSSQAFEAEASANPETCFPEKPIEEGVHREELARRCAAGCPAEDAVVAEATTEVASSSCAAGQTGLAKILSRGEFHTLGGRLYSSC